MLRARQVRNRFGQISVSMITASFGRTRSRKRRTGPLRSYGRYTWNTRSPNSFSTRADPVGVTVVTTNRCPWKRRISASIKGAEAFTSPIETAWIQMESWNPGAGKYPNRSGQRSRYSR
jgi:hypothetical protein